MKLGLELCVYVFVCNTTVVPLPLGMHFWSHSYCAFVRLDVGDRSQMSGSTSCRENRHAVHPTPHNARFRRPRRAFVPG